MRGGPDGRRGPGGQGGQGGPSAQAMAAHDLNRAYRALGMNSDASAPEAVKLVALSRSWYSVASDAYTAKNYEKAHQVGLASAELSDAAGAIASDQREVRAAVEWGWSPLDGAGVTGGVADCVDGCQEAPVGADCLDSSGGS